MDSSKINEIVSEVSRREQVFGISVPDVVFDIARTKSLREGVEMMMERWMDFPDKLSALFAGIAVNPLARQRFENALDEEWSYGAPLPDEVDELVVGSGVHSAIYCASRYRSRGIRPLVVEGGDRIGGTMAMSRNPSFWLNSRNRPGPLGVPGQSLGLNVIEGGLIQPSLISGAEYQTNADLAFAIRANLAIFSKGAISNMKVASISRKSQGSNRYRVVFDSGEQVTTPRVVIATGSGQRTALGSRIEKLERLITFEEFMARMDEPFPLRGMGRVAVIGAGDSGKCAIQALCGQGPTSGGSVAMLDWPQKVDWFGLGAMTPETWCRSNRGLYARIGGLLGKRVFPRDRASNIVAEYNGVSISDRQYDWVINCTQLIFEEEIEIPWAKNPLEVQGKRIGAQYRSKVDPEEEEDIFRSRENIFVVGPASRIPVTGTEIDAIPAVNTIPDNSTSLFRYAKRTAMVAAMT